MWCGSTSWLRHLYSIIRLRFDPSFYFTVPAAGGIIYILDLRDFREHPTRQNLGLFPCGGAFYNPKTPFRVKDKETK